MEAGRKIRVFSDFDGTVSVDDIGATLFNRFAGARNRDTVLLWMQRKIDSRECLLRECSYITASRAEMEAEVEKIALRPGFRRFLGLLHQHQVPIHLVSDGLDFYIKAFLRRLGLAHLDVHANIANFIDGRVYPEFPYAELGCGFCATCKGERVRAIAKPGEFKVYIGDGLSDRCALDAADLVFARGDFAQLCKEKGVDYVPFEEFLQVADYFRDKLFVNSRTIRSRLEES
jgi:2,3-diketo-5-methylthio-1-phosphopentane phosphatase